MAERIARASYRGGAAVTRVERFENPKDLVNFKGAAWRVDFDVAAGLQPAMGRLAVAP